MMEIMKYMKSEIAQQTFLVFQDVFKTCWRRVEDVFKAYLQYVFVKRLQNVFKTSYKTSCNYVLKTSSRRLHDALEDKKMLHSRRLEDVLKTSSVRLHQEECLLGVSLKGKKEELAFANPPRLGKFPRFLDLSNNDMGSKSLTRAQNWNQPWEVISHI